MKFIVERRLTLYRNGTWLDDGTFDTEQEAQAHIDLWCDYEEPGEKDYRYYQWRIVKR